MFHWAENLGLRLVSEVDMQSTVAESNAWTFAVVVMVMLGRSTVLRLRRAGRHPASDGASVAIITHDPIHLVNRTAAAVVDNPGLLAAVSLSGGGGGGKRAKAKNGGEEERAKFHDLRMVDGVGLSLERRPSAVLFCSHGVLISFDAGSCFLFIGKFIFSIPHFESLFPSSNFVCIR